MKKAFFALILGLAGFAAFAQELPTVAVATFDVMGGVAKDEAQVVTELFMTELVSKGSVNVVDRVNFDKIIAEMKFQTSDWSNSQKTAALGQALNAGYVIRGQLMKMGGVIYWTATMIDVNTAQVLYSAREQVSDLGEVFGKLSGFCSQMLAKLPAPNYFIGRWRTGGIKWVSFWENPDDIDPYHYSYISNQDDDILKEVIMYENRNCLITTKSDEKIEGSYAYDYNKPYFSLSAGRYQIEGKLFLNAEKTQFFIQFNIETIRNSTHYGGYFKSLIKAGN
ncbi:MAG: CsgG/HfaB family protein [Treponema sp.]|jgi:TolB-like protein|nr:CsgG/HfaB family protein [Treponema sp.]